MEQEKVEKRVAKTILQKPFEIEVGGTKYSVPQPSIATLIMASEILCQFPNVELKEDTLVIDCLRSAKEFKCIGNVFATLILGSKNINNTVETGKTLFGKKKEKVYDIISRKIVEDYTPMELTNMLVTLIDSLQIGFFFRLITSLQEVNTLKTTKTS